MNYNRKIMRLELSAEKALNGGYYYAELLLPAADYEIKDATLERLKGECVKEVKRLNGNFTFHDANDWQKG